VISAVHNAITEGDLEDFLKGNVRPHRLWEIAARRKDFVSAE
jgi:hypothetical protein